MNSIKNEFRINKRRKTNINMKPQNFYFTFGSWKGFPFQNGYILVRALDEADAVATFRQHYPDVHQNTVNCSFIYSEQEWQMSNNSYDVNRQFEVLVSPNLDVSQEISKEEQEYE